MRPVRKLAVVCGAAALLLLSSVPTATAGGGGDHSSINVLLTDLNSPKGLAVNAGKNLVLGRGLSVLPDRSSSPRFAVRTGTPRRLSLTRSTSPTWRIKPNADGAWCSVNTPDPTHKCSLVSSGYTAIQDMAFGS